MDHGYQDRVSLELHRRIAAELPRRPEWIAQARDTLRRWSARYADSPGELRLFEEWHRILDRPIEEVCAVLLDESEEGVRLRHNAPFTGILSPKEVWDIKARVRHEAA